MRNKLMRKMCIKEFVRTHVIFGLTKALDKDETSGS